MPDADNLLRLAASSRVNLISHQFLLALGLWCCADAPSLSLCYPLTVKISSLAQFCNLPFIFSVDMPDKSTMVKIGVICYKISHFIFKTAKKSPMES